jgi:hypothetical protein
MKILVYFGKHGDEYFLVDTPERLEAALRYLFKLFDEWGCYSDDEEDIVEARAGNARAIRWVLERHCDYEYEEWRIETALDLLA